MNTGSWEESLWDSKISQVHNQSLLYHHIISLQKLISKQSLNWFAQNDRLILKFTHSEWTVRHGLDFESPPRTKNWNKFQHNYHHSVSHLIACRPCHLLAILLHVIIKIEPSPGRHSPPGPTNSLKIWDEDAARMTMTKKIVGSWSSAATGSSFGPKCYSSLIENPYKIYVQRQQQQFSGATCSFFCADFLPLHRGLWFTSFFVFERFSVISPGLRTAAAVAMKRPVIIIIHRPALNLLDRIYSREES